VKLRRERYKWVGVRCLFYEHEYCDVCWVVSWMWGEVVPACWCSSVIRLAFSADGSKFAMAISHGRVPVWDIRSKVPLKTFMEIPEQSNSEDFPV